MRELIIRRDESGFSVLSQEYRKIANTFKFRRSWNVKDMLFECQDIFQWVTLALDYTDDMSKLAAVGKLGFPVGEWISMKRLLLDWLESLGVGVSWMGTDISVLVNGRDVDGRRMIGSLVLYWHTAQQKRFSVDSEPLGLFDGLKREK